MHDDAAALTDVLAERDAEERRRAARALLRRPLLTASHPAFPLVRRHADALREWFAAEPGWVLTVDAEVARLRKIPAAPVDGTRPALAPRTGKPFSRRRYVLLCLALAALERADGQTTLGWLADRVLDLAGDPALRDAGVDFRLEGRDERGDLVAVVRLLLDLGVLARVAGDEESFLAASGDALYDVQRRALAGMLAAPRGPSTVTADDFEERLAALVAEPVPDADAARTRLARQELNRRLLDDPVTYLDAIGEPEVAYLATQRAAVVRRIVDASGMVAEVRAEGLALLDPTGEATDLGMPEDGTEGHATLLLAGHLASVETPVERAALAPLVRGWAARYPWRKAARDDGAEHGLVDHAVATLAALSLVRLDGDHVVPLPAIARFAVDEPLVLGGGDA